MSRHSSHPLSRLFSARPAQHARKPSDVRRHRRLWMPEGLEDRVLLAATIYTVNAITDTGAGSGTTGDLLYCINQADSNPNTDGSLIQFDPTVFSSPQTIPLSSALPDLNNTAGLIDIEGPGPANLTVSRSSGDDTPDFSVFTIDPNASVTLAGLTISGGSVAGDGGGINNSGTLTVDNSAIENNSVSDNGSGGYGQGGGIYNAGTMTVTNSVIDNNLAVILGGGISNSGALTVTNSAIDNNCTHIWGGGIANLFGTMTVTNCTIASNSATVSLWGATVGGGISNDNTMTVIDCTIASNSASIGGGVGVIDYSTGTVTNCTIASNSATLAGGGICVFGPGDATLTVTNATIADNNVASGGAGGGFSVQNEGLGILNNTIAALNTNGGTTADDVSAVDGGTVSSASGYNLIGTGGSGGLLNGINGNQVGVADPGLGTLADNGGPTQTMALLAGSPAINAGSNALAVNPTTGQPLPDDQRGPGFPRIEDGTVNVGAFEVQPANYAATQLAVMTQPPAVATVGVGFGLVVAAEDPSGGIDPDFTGSVTISLLDNPGGATLGGTLTVTAQYGVAAFSGLTLDEVGTGYTLQATTSGLASATTNPFDVQSNTSPTQYMVDLTGATGSGSGTVGDLPYVVARANANTNPLGSVIAFDPTVFGTPQTITLSSTLTLSETAGPEVIDGPGASLVTVSGGGAVGVFSVSSGVMATLAGVTISHGAAADGGGILNNGTVTVADSTIDNNSASSPGYGGGGGIYNAGTMTVSDSAINSNHAGGVGGEYGNYFWGYGGGIYNAGTMTVSDSAIDSNQAGVNGGGILNYGGTMTVANSIIANNSASPAYAGGIDNDGTVTVSNCTITNNSAVGIDNGGMLTVAYSTIAYNSYGGIHNEGTLTVAYSAIDNNSVNGGIWSEGTATVSDSTIANNSAIGIINLGALTAVDDTIVYNGASCCNGLIVNYGGLLAGGTTTLDNTIVVLNTWGTGGSASDIIGAVSGAYNLIGTGGSGGLTNGVNGNQVGVADPGLDPNGLQNNGGPTQTIALLPGSPAIDAGSDNIPSVSVPATDQRGVMRPADHVNIGAFQDRGFQLTLVAGSSPQRAAVNTAFPNPLAVSVTSPYGDPVAGGVISFVVTPTTGGASAMLSASTATIAADGQASVIATANGIVGGYTVSASAAGATPTVRFRLRNTPGRTGAAVAAESVSLGTSQGAGVAPVRVGTTGQAAPRSGAAGRGPAAWAAPRAEIWLAARGRGWSLGTSTSTKSIGHPWLQEG